MIAEKKAPIDKNTNQSQAEAGLPEAMLKVLKHNTNGLVFYREEESALLKGMAREGRAEQCALFASWSGERESK